MVYSKISSRETYKNTLNLKIKFPGCYTKDPFDYLEAFKTIIQLQAVPEEIMCRAFPMGLRGSVRV